jgi:hypothetical protein
MRQATSRHGGVELWSIGKIPCAGKVTVDLGDDCAATSHFVKKYTNKTDGNIVDSFLLCCRIISI